MYQDFGQNAPYYDDFDESKNFLRLLFNPGRAIQARELTQLQTVLQSQLGHMASHIFKENTSVFQAKINISNKKPTVKIKQLALIHDANNNSWGEDGTTIHSLTNSWIGKTFQNNDPMIVGTSPSKTITITGYDVVPGEDPILYYEYSGENVVANERFYDSGNNGTPVGGITIAADPTRSLVAACDAGVIWTRGHFVTVTPQEKVINNDPTQGDYRVGFVVKEEVVTSEDPYVGTTLLDPANGSFNFNAPGADRYRMTAELHFYDIAKEAELTKAFLDSFVPFFTLSNGETVEDKTKTQYSDILEMLARRTYDESGNYTVEDFSLVLKEAKELPLRPGKTVITLSDYPGYIQGKDDIEDYLYAEMGPGKAYVLGYEIEKLQSTPILIYKGRDTQLVENKLVNVDSTFYLVGKTDSGETSSNKLDGEGDTTGWMDFHKLQEVEIMDGLNGQGRVLTKARIAGLDRRGQTFRIHLMDSNKPNAAANASGLLSSPVATTLDQVNVVEGINFTNILSARSIRVAGTQAKHINLALNASDTRNIFPLFGGIPTPPLYAIQGIDTLKTHSSNVDITIAGQYSFTISSGSGTVTSSDGAAVFEDNAEDVVIYAYNKTKGKVLDVGKIQGSPAGNVLTITSTLPASDWANGDNIEVSLKSRHSTSNVRTKTKTSKTVNVTINNPNQDVVILPDEDVIKIVSITQTTNTATERALTTNEMIQLRFDNGQRDYFYDRASLTGWSKLFNGNKTTVHDGTNYVATTYRIVYEFYEHEIANNKLFFSAKSYSDFNNENDYVNFPVYRSQNYGDFDLLNFLDFRRKVSEMEQAATAISFPQSFDEVQIDDIEHYVGRIVNVWMDRNGNFNTTEGVATLAPQKPLNPVGVMNLYSLYVPPYTFNKNEVSIEADKNLRYTMQDIRSLDERIERLEEYVSLTMLEKNAFDLEVVDPATGFDRFKSGIFVDPFRDHRFADSKNPDYRVTVDAKNQAIHCPIEMHSFNLDVDSNTTTAQQHKNIITLPVSSTKELTKNLHATQTVNVNPYLFFTWRGTVELSPSVDTWYETKVLPEVNITVGSFEAPAGFNPTPRVDEIKQTWTGFLPNNRQQMNSTAYQVGFKENIPDVNGDGRTNAADLNQMSQDRVGLARPDASTRISNTLKNKSSRTLRGSEVQLPPPKSIPSFNIVQYGLQRNGFSSSRGGLVGFPSEYNEVNGDNWRYKNIFQRSRNPNRNEVQVDVTRRTSKITTQTLVKHEKKTVDDRVVDRSVIPFMRSRWVKFVAQGLRPGVIIRCELDGKEVATMAAGNQWWNNPGQRAFKDVKISSQRTTRSEFIKTDSNGEAHGFFLIPPNTFTTGRKKFTVKDVEDTSGASSTYTAKGILTTKQKTITTIRSVEVREAVTTEVEESATLTTLAATNRWKDPIAQSFQVTQTGGCFLKSIDLYFATKPGDFDNTARVINGVNLKNKLAEIYGEYHPRDFGSKNRGLLIYIVPMENGIPASEIVPLSTKVVSPSQINSHPTIPMNGRTTIHWDDPVYLEENSDYAVVVYSTSKEYHCWISELGKQDIFEFGKERPGKGIAEQPNLGTFFKSQNSATWTPEQMLDLTFQLRYCQFSTDPKMLVMKDSKKMDDLTFGGDFFKVWDTTTIYKPNDVVSAIVGPNGSQYVKMFQNTSGADIAANTPPPENGGNGWSEVTQDAYDEYRASAKRYGNKVFPIVGEMKPIGTDISYDHAFYQGNALPSNASFKPAENQEENDVRGDSQTEKILDNAASPNNYAIRAHLKTTNPNISPVMDKDQMRGVLIRNVVLGVDPDLKWGGQSNDQVSTVYSSNGYDAAFESGKFKNQTNYKKNDVVYLQDDPNTFFVYADSAQKSYTQTGNALTVAFLADLKAGKWYKEPLYKPPFVDGRSGIGDCGTYVSKTVNLEKVADDLKMIVDLKTPKNTYFNVYYRFAKDAPQFVYTTPYTEKDVDFSSFIGKKVKIKYRGTSAGNQKIDSKNPASGTYNVKMFIKGVEEHVQTGQKKRYKLFLSSVAENSAFPEGLTYDAKNAITGGAAFTGAFVSVNNAFLILDSNGDLELLDNGAMPDLEVWNASETYSPGDQICSMDLVSSLPENFKVWKSRGYIAPTWNNGTAYAANAIVIHSTGVGAPHIAYKAITGSTGVTPGSDTSKWLPLLQSNGTPYPAYGVGTKPSELGTAWERIPCIGVQSAIKNEDVSTDWRPMVPEKQIDMTKLDGNKYYEWTFVPKVKPEIEFGSYQIRLDMRNVGFNRINVPTAKNLRVIALY